jgi:predicted site-specific integrase-resolvase
VKILVIAHKDRLCRFGFEWFERLCTQHGCAVLILNNESLSPEEEMVQDLMPIGHCFSSRLYGLRNHLRNCKRCCKHLPHDRTLHRLFLCFTTCGKVL